MYLDEWQQSVESRPGFTRKQKQHMLLSSETMRGLRITGYTVTLLSVINNFLPAAKSFVEMIRYLFAQADVRVFLSRRIRQDPLEQFFGCQRQRGGTHENPNCQEFMRNTQALKVINSFCKVPSKVNCRGNLDRDIGDENEPLPKHVPSARRK